MRRVAASMLGGAGTVPCASPTVHLLGRSASAAVVTVGIQQAIRSASSTVCLGGPTRTLRFDLRKHRMEQRRAREMEKAGIDPDDDTPWIDAEEQQRLDEEELKRRAMEEERRQELLEKRALEDVEKRKRFKEFRVRQVAMSRNRKEAAAARKAEGWRSREAMDGFPEDEAQQQDGLGGNGGPDGGGERKT